MNIAGYMIVYFNIAYENQHVIVVVHRRPGNVILADEFGLRTANLCQLLVWTELLLILCDISCVIFCEIDVQHVTLA